MFTRSNLNLNINPKTLKIFNELKTSVGVSSNFTDMLVETMLDNILVSVALLLEDPKKESLHFNDLLPILQIMFPHTQMRSTTEKRPCYKNHGSFESVVNH